MAPSWLAARSRGLPGFLMGTGWKSWAQRLPRMTKTEKNLSCHSCANQRGVEEKFRFLMSCTAKREKKYIKIRIHYAVDPYIKEEAFTLSKSGLKLILPVVYGN